MALTLSESDGEKMRELQRALTDVLMRANDQKLEAALAVFACVRCARTLLDLYGPDVRAQLADVVIAFLKHEDMTAEPMGLLLH
jgi:hypothetical protein